jgi:hypothetical protein
VPSKHPLDIYTFLRYNQLIRANSAPHGSRGCGSSRVLQIAAKGLAVGDLGCPDSENVFTTLIAGEHPD